MGAQSPSDLFGGEKKHAGRLLIELIANRSPTSAANVYAKARIPPAKSVQLWLGADIMLEYPIEEARGVLQDNHDKCQKALDDNKEAWDQLKDCKTTCEVNIARCHNYDVEKRKKGKGCGAE